ncbi:MAG: hypothetical protein ACREFK_20075, partial [Stellaceae bacterium]
LDLYRSGNSMGPRMEHVRPKDVKLTQQNGVDWIYPNSGGVSTFEQRFWRARKWRLLPHGTDFSDLLVVWKDHGIHWVWEPAQGMEFAEYVRLLSGLNAGFIPA